MKAQLSVILNKLKVKKKSLIAFNLQSLYQLDAIQSLASQLELPIIIQFSERYIKFLDEKYTIDYLIKNYGNEYIYFHLDHSIDPVFIKYCIDSGFDSVMYDGSSLNVEQNIANTIEIVQYAKDRGCLVEGEVGEVAGVEDGFGNEGSTYANIEDAIKYAESTKIDLLALGIGNAHGFYEDISDIDISIMQRVSEKLNNQLFVLHGGTGLPDTLIQEVISYGVVKINISTYVKKATYELVRQASQIKKLHDEISFHNHIVSGLKPHFEKFVLKYTQ